MSTDSNQSEKERANEIFNGVLRELVFLYIQQELDDNFDDDDPDILDRILDIPGVRVGIADAFNDTVFELQGVMNQFFVNVSADNHANIVSIYQEFKNQQPA